MNSAQNAVSLMQIVVSDNVRIDNRGFGLCPFHNEKTASFRVFKASNGKEFFRCFGCGKSGDVVDYLVLRHGLGVGEAVRFVRNGGKKPWMVKQDYALRFGKLVTLLEVDKKHGQRLLGQFWKSGKFLSLCDFLLLSSPHLAAFSPPHLAAHLTRPLKADEPLPNDYGADEWLDHLRPVPPRLCARILSKRADKQEILRQYERIFGMRA